MFAYETAAAPVYVMRFAGRFDLADERAYLDALHDLVTRPAGFVLLIVMTNENKMSQEGYKEMSLWFKARKEALGRICKGLVRVRPGRVADPEDDANFRKAMPFPSCRAGSEEEGWAAAREMLAA